MEELTNGTQTNTQDRLLPRTEHPLLMAHLFRGWQGIHSRRESSSGEIRRLLSLLELSNLKQVREIAFSDSFKSANGDFLRSGEAVYIAVKSQLYSFGKELIAHGYAMPPNLLIDAITSEKKEESLRLIFHGYFCETPDLEYWLLLRRSWTNLAMALKKECPALSTAYTSGSDDRLVNRSITQALVRGFIELAEEIALAHPNSVQDSIIRLALQYKHINFVHKCWTHMSSKQITIHRIINYLLHEQRFGEVRNVLSWPHAADQPGLFSVFIRFDAPELTKKYLARRKTCNSIEEFNLSFSKRKYQLAAELLSQKHIRAILCDWKLQGKIVALIEDGEYCACAAEMLSLIKVKYWNPYLTGVLCTALERFVKKTQNILMCQKPLLFLVLVAEFLCKIQGKNLLYEISCQKTLKVVIDFAKELEKNMLEEDVLQYFLLQTDLQNRSALYIISSQNFHQLLEHPDLDSIVRKLWVGSRKNLGLRKASTIYLTSGSNNAEDSLRLLKRTSQDKPYCFQFQQWTDSCKLRFFGQAATTTFLVCIYTLMVHFATQSGNMKDVSQDPTALVFLRISQFWNTGFMLEKILHMIFQYKTGQKLLDKWAILDLVMFFQMIALMLELNTVWAGEGKVLSFLDPKDFNALMHGLMLALIWVRLLSVLMTTVLYGTLLKLIVLILIRLIPYFCILFIVYFMSALLFTIFFSDSRPETFLNFSYSIRTLFAASYNNHDMAQFEETDQRLMGEVSLGVYIFFTFVIMKNFLIAILANTYQELKTKVESEYRSTLVSFHNKWKWNDKYGILIIMPSPMSWVVILVAPFLLMSKNPQRFNKIFARSLFILFVIPQFLLFAFVSAVYIPGAFYRSLIAYAKRGNKKRARIHIIRDAGEEQEKVGQIYNIVSYKRAILWTFVGPFIVLGAYFRDLFDFWMMLYIEIKRKKHNGSYVKEQFFDAFQNYLDTIEAKELTFNEFLEGFTVLYKSSFQTEIKEFFWRFRLINNVVDVDSIKKLLRKQDSYPAYYVKFAKHVCIPWVHQAIENYQRLIGSISIHGILIPKVYITGETPQVKRMKAAVLKTNAVCREMRNYYNDLSMHMEALTSKLEECYTS